MSFSLKNNNMHINDVINNRIKMCFERFKYKNYEEYYFNLPIFGTYEKIRNGTLKFKIRKCYSCQKTKFITIIQESPITFNDIIKVINTNINHQENNCCNKFIIVNYYNIEALYYKERYNQIETILI